MEQSGNSGLDTESNTEGRKQQPAVQEYVTRLLGYGAVDINRVQACTARRVTALGGGTLREDESHIHAFHCRRH